MGDPAAPENSSFRIQNTGGRIVFVGKGARVSERKCAVSQDNIELMVDEPIPGHYYWMLLKEDPEQHPQAVDYAQGPLPSYSAAMMAGIAALQRRADARADGDSSPVITAFATSPTDFSDSHRGGLHH